MAIAGAIARRNIHAAAERDGEMRIIAANALALVEGFPRRLGCAGVLIAERDMTVNEVANRLNTGPPRPGLLEQLPGNVGQPVGLAVPAPEEVNDGVRRQVLDGVLRG